MNRNPLLALVIVWSGWAAGFLLLYALQATGCRAGWDDHMTGPVSTLRLLLIAAAASLVLALIGLSWKARADARASPLARIVALANGAAILATFCFSGVLWLSLCA